MMFDKKKKQFTLFAFSCLVVLFFVAGNTGARDTQAAMENPLVDSRSPKEPNLEEPEPDSEVKDSEETPSSLDEISEESPPSDEEDSNAPVPSNPWINYPNVCESFQVIQSIGRVKDDKGGWVYPLNYKRNRYIRTNADKARTRALIELVAREMGVQEPRFFAAFALHESTWNPEAIHILNPDREANQIAWEQHSYSRGRENELEAQLQITSAQSQDFWKIRTQLSNLRLYKGNPHWEDRIQYDFTIPERSLHQNGETTILPAETHKDSRNVWAFGYGLYGMYAVGYTHIWDHEAPPWVLCGDEGIIATIVQVWAARSAAQECDNLTEKNPEKWGADGGTYEGVVRRIGRGHCGSGRLGKAWQQIMKEYSTVPWGEHANFGDKWPRYEMEKKHGKWVYKKDAEGKKIPADREVILAHMLKRAAEEGLLRENPLQRKLPGSEPVILPGKQVGNTSKVSSYGNGAKTAAP